VITLDAVVRTLRPIGLDELVERASLLSRLDRKYILPIADLPFVLGGLADDVMVLEMDGLREFGYRSVYFDTPGLDSYLAAARSRRRRFKLRVRSYLDSDQHFLEVKTRDGRGNTVKNRIPYAGDHLRLGSDALAYAGTVLAEAGIHTGPLQFEPVLTTHYLRTTLFVPSPGSRVTIDTGLAWILPDGAALGTPERAIVEIKSERVTSDVDRLLWSMKHRPCSVSKYGTGLAALRPDLPSNRWHPVLRRHFHTASNGS
jgi:hypothetical protein